MSPNDLFVAGYRIGRDLLHRMVDDLREEEFRHQPVSGANSAAWIIGHLALTARRTAERLGATGLPEVSEEFAARFNTTKKPAEAQKELGTKAELLALFDASVEKLIEAVGAVATDALDRPQTATPFATNSGETILFGAMHVTMHCGQLSTIRRSLGKPPVV